MKSKYFGVTLYNIPLSGDYCRSGYIEDLTTDDVFLPLNYKEMVYIEKVTSKILNKSLEKDKRYSLAGENNVNCALYYRGNYNVDITSFFINISPEGKRRGSSNFILIRRKYKLVDLNNLLKSLILEDELG